MTRRYRRVLAAATGVVIAAGVLVGGAPANADPYGSGSGTHGYLPDSAAHTWCSRISYITAWDTPITDAINNLDNQTDMSDTRISVCASTTDAVIMVSDTAGTGGVDVRGSTVCTKVTSGRCDSATIRLNADLLTNYTQRRKTACHEIGHTVGMSHDGAYGGCMVSGISSASTYSSHHVAHVNATF